MRKLPEGYREADACATCRHCFVETPYDDSTSYYCAVEPGRPKSDTEANDEYFESGKDETDEELMARTAAWFEWSRDHWVRAWGICPRYERMEAEHGA